MKVYKDFSLSEILYYKIGGKAKFVLKIQTKEDLFEALSFLKENTITRVFPVGLGSNLLVSDAFFDGAVLWFSPKETPLIVKRSNDSLEVFAGVLLDDLIQFSFRNNLVGLEWAGGLPSTIGGAIRGNAGAFGSTIGDSVVEVEYVNLAKKDHAASRISASSCTFSYRNSIFKQNSNLIIASGTFYLTNASKEEVEKARQVYVSHIQHREAHNPLEYPSCGSTFKNITLKKDVQKIIDTWLDIGDFVTNKWHEKVSMGYIIKRLGFSGLQVGGAKVSEKHANYILNVNNARFNDVYTIIERIKEKFFEEFGFYPEEEVEIIS